MQWTPQPRYNRCHLVEMKARGHRAYSLGALLLVLALGSTARAGDQSHDARVHQLADLLAQDPSFKVRASAAQRLGAIGPLSSDDERTASRALITALNDKNDIVRGVAAHSIG